MGYRKESNVLGNSKYRIGFEIEKEDDGIMDYDCSDKGYAEGFGFGTDINNWNWGGDSSLNEHGFEVRSPILPLKISALRKELRASDNIKRAIKADFTDNCGGHIHVSEREKKGRKLYSELLNYMPLLFAMYPDRVNNSYCRKYGRNELEKAESRNSIYLVNPLVGGNVELRIFPAVIDEDSLLDRARFMKFMMSHRVKNPITIIGYILNNEYFRNVIVRMIKRTGGTLEDVLDRFSKEIVEFDSGKKVTNRESKILDNIKKK